MIQMFFVYNNYDNLSYFLSFDVFVEGIVVFSWWYFWVDDFNNYGVYLDFVVFIYDGFVIICFYSIGIDVFVIGFFEFL